MTADYNVADSRQASKNRNWDMVASSSSMSLDKTLTILVARPLLITCIEEAKLRRQGYPSDLQH